MTKARLSRRQTSQIFDSWLAAGHVAYIGRFEVVGDKGRPLSSVLESAQDAMKAVLGGGGRTSERQRLGISGQVSTLEVARVSSGCWVVRRWVVLATERALNAEDLVTLERSMAGRWIRSIGRSNEAFSSKAVNLKAVDREEVEAVSMLVTQSISAADRLSKRTSLFLEGLRLTFDLSESEIAAPELAQRYRESRYSRKTGLIPVAAPSEADAFHEYAKQLFKVSIWAAQISTQPGEATKEWNEILVRAKALKPEYLDSGSVWRDKSDSAGQKK